MWGFKESGKRELKGTEKGPRDKQGDPPFSSRLPLRGLYRSQNSTPNRISISQCFKARGLGLDCLDLSPASITSSYV